MPSTQFELFRASYDSTTKILTAIVCVIFVVPAASAHNGAIVGLGALLLALAYAYSPRGYTIQERSIVVRRLIGDARIALDGVREVRAGTGDDFRGCIRLWGNGGLFGYYGLFRTSKLGKSTWYVTNRSHAVVVVTAARTVVLSPDEVDPFLEAIRASVPVPVAPPDGIVPGSAPSRTAGNRIGALLGGGVGFAALAAVAFGMLYSPGPPNCTLTPQSLTVHDRFYPVTLQAASVDAGRVRVVDISADSGWRPVSRVNGFANSHYHSGWFRVANGQKARMYWADGTRLILLPPKGDGVSVLLQVKEPEQFLEELRQEWLHPKG